MSHGASARTSRWTAPLAAASLIVLPSACRDAEPATPPRIAAASDLAVAFQEVGAAYARRTGVEPVFTFGSTGLLAKQLREGAPFDVFAAANVSFVEDVVRQGACDGATKTLYGRGRVVVWGRAGAPVPARLEGLLDPRVQKIALANPEHAPYGKAAKQALEKAGLWPSIERKVVYAENVQQALKFAQSGNAEVALVALSLAIGTQGGSYLEVDAALHLPLDQALVVCNHGQSRGGGESFGRFVASEEGRVIMKRHGFLLPGELREPP